MFKRATLLTILIALFTLGVFSASAQEEPPADEPQPGVSLTVYNQGTALVRDRRVFSFTEGLNTINFTDVASSIDATSVSFVSLTDPNTTVLEQNYVYDLVDTYALIRRFVDQVITVTASDGTVYTGRLLSGSDNLILQTDNGQVVVLNAYNLRDIQFPALPDGLITRPTLRWLVSSPITGDQEIELTYLTGGISWTADYNVLLTTDKSALDLNGWVTLSNSSGTSYRDAQLKLIAGDVNRLPEYFGGGGGDVMYNMVPTATAQPQVAQREFFEYKLYEINRPVTVGNNETKQVEFVTATSVPATTYYVYDASDAFYGYYSPIVDTYYGFTGITDVQNYLEFTTSEEAGVGADLPAGRVRVYQEDVDGAALLIGENSIDHTPKGEDVSIYLGNAFDLVGERIQTDFRIISDKVMQETYQITLRNRKEGETVEIRVPERLFRWSNWEILSATIDGQSAEFTQQDSATIEFRVQVPAGGEVVLTYTVQYSW